MAKLFVTDLDGTLLNSRKEITPFSRDILKKTATAGHYIVPATARGFYRIRTYVQQLDVRRDSQYAITFNGSVVSDFLGTTLLDGCLSAENMNLLLRYIEQKPHMKWALYISDRTVDFSDISDPAGFIRENPVYKVVCLAEREVIRKEREALNTELRETTEMTSSEPTRMEFVRKGASKVNAIRFLAERLNIADEDIYAFGDGENDIGMMDLAAHSVAVANASEEVRKHATFITAGNDEDGVARYLKTILGL